MASFRIPLLAVRELAGGAYGYYWQPSPTLKKAGWKPVNLGIAARPDDPAKLDLARARNDEVAAWRNGGAKPRAVKRFAPRNTAADLVRAYKDSPRYTDLAASTRRTYDIALNLFQTWATDPRAPGGDGNLPLQLIDRDRVERLRDGLMKPRTPGGAPQATRAHGTLRVVRTLLQFAADKGLIPSNPALRFDLAAPPPRDQVWEPDDVAAMSVALGRLGLPSLAFVLRLSEYFGQRVSDTLAMRTTQWREMHNLDRETRDAVGDAQGRVWGIHVRQNKTKRWVGNPTGGPLRAEIEAAIAADAGRAVPTGRLVVNATTGRPWDAHRCANRLAEARAWAIDPPADARAAGVEPRPELAGLQLRDLRRTCIVRLGELGLEDQLIAAISGHSLASIKAILEVYMPRTAKMAGRAVVARLRAGEADRPTLDATQKAG